MIFPTQSTPNTNTNPPKSISGFTLPSTTQASSTAPLTGGFQFAPTQAAGDNKPAPSLFGTSFTQSAGLPKTTAPTLSFGTSASQTPSTGGFNFGTNKIAQGAAATGVPFSSIGFGTPVTSTTITSLTSSVPSLSGATTISVAASTTATISTTVTKPSLGIAPATTTTSAATTTSTTGFSLGVPPAITTTSTSLVPVQTSSSTTTSTSPSLSFAQLEDSINKWTIYLEEQGKFFVNQAKQLNAWDTLLISNGEKILNLNSSIERVKQQQSQLDQELDFILAQQRELEELIVPLEKDLVDTPLNDVDRNQMYQFSEIIDSQLKQISDDLKEIIENINETNKDEEGSNPITQIGKILNAHMNSLQWVDRNTSQISRQLQEITRIEEANRRNLNLNN
ncbi:hypothetical protein ABEB36_006944 [Hypothenemus hampei]|uniref:Nucleoporin NSP1-like C-terminal domain-containing protein n=1 Tax=Hypothenemus hampei TaxID=57062 RepID=A0ABD1ESR7_HYPHA